MITLAQSGVGKITSFAGSIYTIATSSPSTSTSSTRYAVLNRTNVTIFTKKNTYYCSNGAMANGHFFHISAPLLSALAATVGGVILGAWATL